MNEKKKILVVLGVLAAVLLFIILIAVTSRNNDEEVYAQFEETFTKEEYSLVYIGRPTCSYCALFEPNLKDMSNRYDFDYIYINIDEFSNSYFSKVIDKLGLSEVGTPYTVVINKDGIVDTLGGYVDYDVLFEFLKKYNFIDEAEELLIDFIGIEDYKSLLTSSNNEVVVIGQSTCGYCTSAKIALLNIASEYDIDINYVNLSYFSEAEYDELMESFDYLKGEWGTPLMFIIKDGKMIAVENGFASQNTYITFLKNNGVI